MQFPSEIPFARHVGLELVRMGAGEAELRLDLRHDLHNSFAVGHGGALMTALDVAMAHAARSLHPPPAYRPGAVTIEMKTTFLRAAKGSLRIVGRLLHHTATLAFCEGVVLNESGEACATATGTFKMMRALPAHDGEIHLLKPSAGS